MTADTSNTARFKLNLDRAFRDVWQVFKKGWLSLAGLQVISAASVALFYVFALIVAKNLASDFSELEKNNALYPLIAIGIALVAALFFFMNWVSASSALVAHRSMTGEERKAGRALVDSWPQVGRLLLFNLMITGIVLAVYAVLAVPVALLISSSSGGDAKLAWAIGLSIILVFVFIMGLAVLGSWLYIKLGFVTFAIVVEKKGIGDAIRRSFSLTLKNFWASLGVIFLGSMIVSVAVSVLMYIISIPLMITWVVSLAAYSKDNVLPLGVIIGFAAAQFLAQTIMGMGIWSLWGGLYSQLKDNTPSSPSSPSSS